MLPDPSACVPTHRNEFYEAFLGNTRQFLDQLPSLHVAWHGDDPWIGPISPFRELYNMVTRVRRRADGSICMPADWQLATRITVDEGLGMMTRNSAYALFREDEVGSLELGKLADLIVVSKNPFDVAPEELWDIDVTMTMIGGEVVFCRAGQVLDCLGLGRARGGRM
jgi:predicted amidohydrolase YtcJ